MSNRIYSQTDRIEHQSAMFNQPCLASEENRMINKENRNPNLRQKNKRNFQKKNFKFQNLESPKASSRYSFYSRFCGDSAISKFSDFSNELSTLDCDRESKEVAEWGRGAGCDTFKQAVDKIYAAFKKEIEFLEIKVESFIRGKEKQMRVLQVNLEILTQKIRKTRKNDDKKFSMLDELEARNSDLMAHMDMLMKENEKITQDIKKKKSIVEFKDEIIGSKNTEIKNLTRSMNEIISKVDSQTKKIENLKKKNKKLEETIDESFMQFEIQIQNIVKSQQKRRGQSPSATPRSTRSGKGNPLRRLHKNRGGSCSSNRSNLSKSGRKQEDLQSMSMTIKKLKLMNKEYLKTIELLQGEIRLMHEDNRRMLLKTRDK